MDREGHFYTPKFYRELDSTSESAREVLPIMKEQRWGRLITITSVAVLQPVDSLILSNATRSAVRGLVKSLSNEYARPIMSW